jgi:hypothetical protein
MCANRICKSSPDQRDKIRSLGLCSACYQRYKRLEKAGIEADLTNIAYLPNGRTLYFERICEHKANELAVKACLEKYAELSIPKPQKARLNFRPHSDNKPRVGLSMWLADFEKLLTAHSADVQAFGKAIRESGLFPLHKYFS